MANITAKDVSELRAKTGLGMMDCKKALVEADGDVDKAAEAINEVKSNFYLEPTIAKIATNTIARKSEQVRRGPVTKAMILATEGALTGETLRIAEFTYNKLNEGMTLKEITKALDDEKLNNVQTAASGLFSGMMGKDIQINITNYSGRSRRKENPFLDNYPGFDTRADVEVTVDGEKIVFEELANKILPDAMVNKKMDILEAIPLAAVPITELQLCGHTIINVIVPAAVAGAMGYADGDLKAIAKETVRGAYVTSSIPGGMERAMDVAKRAATIMKDLN